MVISLYPHQENAISRMHNGCILCGGVGSGKSRTALAYYISNESPKPLYVITTARKRDTHDWEGEVEMLDDQREVISEITIDSWNNIKKYIDVSNAFFIFDEQRVVGYGAWVKAFLKITKKNRWILLSATPGDTWMDYVPVFIANGFYKNKRDFIDHHVVYSNYSRYPKIERYLRQGALLSHRNEVVVNMDFHRETVAHDEWLFIPYDKDLTKSIMKTRWNPWKNEPIGDAGALCYALRQAVNNDERRYRAVVDLMETRGKAIIFYNFDYELVGLRKYLKKAGIPYSEWNGHFHESIVNEDRWAYLVQYTAGAEGWNCIETDTIIFFSMNYSYKTMVQSSGRIDRLNTPFHDLYYFHLCSRSPIDLAIRKALQDKKNFNEKVFAESA